MKYPQLVSNRAVSTISDWLVTRLEVLGVEAPIVYSRLLLSLLHTPLQVNSLDVAEIPQLKNWLGKRFNSRRLTQSDAERLKRVAAIESLMEVVEANEKRARIVDLVSELCSKLRELERSEEDVLRQVEEDQSQQQQQQQKRSSERGRSLSGSGEQGAGGASGGGGAEKEKRSSTGSNPYYQMFPALAGNIAASSNSSRGASLSGNSSNSTGGGGTVAATTMNESNWGRGDQQQQQNPAKWRMESVPTTTTSVAGGEQPVLGTMSNGSSTQELFTGGGGGDKGTNKRKNKKRRTNGPSADKRVFATSSPANMKLGQMGTNNNSAQQLATSASGARTKKLSTSDSQAQQFPQPLQQHYAHRQKSAKYVEWDTNFSGQWEMEEQDPIREFLNAQRSAGTTTGALAAAAASDNDCESMTGSGSVQLSAMDEGDDGYDNVFKMKRSDVNEEQTMLIKSFLTKKTMSSDAPSQSNSITARSNHSEEVMMMLPEGEGNGQQDKGLNAVPFGFNFESTEEYFNLISPIEGATMKLLSPDAAATVEATEENRRRLFEREVVVLQTEEDAEPTAEFDAKLDAFKAKFDMSIRNLWGRDEEEQERRNNGEQQQQEIEMEMNLNLNHQQMGQNQQQPLSLNSFWQNYNKHLYEFQGEAVGQSLDSNNNNSCGGWMIGGGVAGTAAGMEGNLGPQQEMNSFNLNAPSFHNQNANPNPNSSSAIWSNDLNEYEEQQQSSQNCLQQYNEHMAAAYQKQMAFNQGLAEGFSGAAADLFAMSKWTMEERSSSFDERLMNSSAAELEQMYYSSYPGCEFNLSASAAMTPDATNIAPGGGDNNNMAAAEVANMKLEQSIALINHSNSSSFAKVDRRWAAATSAASAANRASRMRGSSSSASSSITNLSSLYGSFKQNSMENLLTSERTHFRPIKQAYLDGHTFDIPCSPDTVEYVRTASGSLFFELDKYMEYSVEEPARDAYDEQQQSTNVPISRCGTIDEDSVDGISSHNEKSTTVRAKRMKGEPKIATSENKFTLKFCVQSQNEKCCQTEVIDYEQMQRIELANSLLVMGRAATMAAATMKKYPKNVLPNVCTLVPMDDVDLEAVAYELLEDKWNVTSSSNSGNNNIMSHDMSMLWENSGSNSLDSSLNYESLPANRLLRDELSADAEEILKDSLTYMQNLYIDDMEEDEENSVDRDEMLAMAENDVMLNKSDMDLANYYEMGQLISEILNPGTAKKIAQVFGGGGGKNDGGAPPPTGGENDILWYKNWSQRNWLPILDQCKARNVWHYGGGGNNSHSGVVANNCKNGNIYNNCEATVVSDNNNNTVEERRDVERGGQDNKQPQLPMGCGAEINATDDWKFSNLRKLWNDTQMILNEEEEEEREQNNNKLQSVKGEVVVDADEEEEDGEDEDNLLVIEREPIEDELLLNGVDAEDEEKNYHLIIFEKKKDPSAINSSAVGAKGRKRRHSASQNLFDDDLELFNGDDVKWYDYCCKCDCGKRSEKILRYRNKLLMKRVDKMGYVHNASLLLKNFSKQFDSIDEILNEGLICNATAAAALGAEVCDYEGEYLCGGGGGVNGGLGGLAGTAEKLSNLEQVSLLKNPNLYLNRTALISMSRPLTR